MKRINFKLDSVYRALEEGMESDNIFGFGVTAKARIIELKDDAHTVFYKKFTDDNWNYYSNENDMTPVSSRYFNETLYKLVEQTVCFLFGDVISLSGGRR